MNIFATIADCFRMCVSPFEVLEKYKKMPFNWFLVFFFLVFTFLISLPLPSTDCDPFPPFVLLTAAVIILIFFFIILGKLFGGIARYNHIFQAVLLSIFPTLIIISIRSGILFSERFLPSLGDSLRDFLFYVHELIVSPSFFLIAIMFLMVNLWWILKYYQNIKSLRLFFITAILLTFVLVWGAFVSTLLRSPGFVNCSPDSIVLPPPVVIP